MAKSNMKKKEKVAANSKTVVSDNDFSKLIKVILTIVVVFTVFYFLTVIIQKNQSSERDVTTNRIQYDEILMSKILKQSNTEYYVLIKSQDDKNESSFITLINQMEITRIYTCDLDSAFNQKFKNEQSSLMVSDINELKVKETTLLHIKDNSIVDAKEGTDVVLEYMQTLG